MVKSYYMLFFIFMNIIFPCAVCYGTADGPMVDGMNNAVLFLLGVISFVLLTIIGTIFYFYNRSKTLT